MKKILVVGIAAAAFCGAPALAADMPVKAPVYKAAPAPVFSWTGCYVGGNVGGGWGKDKWTENDGTNLGAPHYSGWAGGGQIGCDWQSGAWVFGVAGMLDWADLTGHAVDPDGAPTTTAHTQAKWFGTTTARLGYAVDRSLVYVDGGAAWMNTKRFLDFNGSVVGVTTSDTKSGWALGVGWEYAFAPNWSWKIEYNHLDFGRETFFVTVTPLVVTSPTRIDTILVGLNYRFGSGGKGPVVAKY
jgi:outer membrane immunogenic protein